MKKTIYEPNSRKTELEKIQSIDANFNALVISHNTEWVPFLVYLKENLLKFKIELHGYINYLQKSSKHYDLMLIYSNSFYDEQVLSNLKYKAKEISLLHNKKVTVGYSYFIPLEKRKNNVSYGAIISIYDNGVEIEETYPIELNAYESSALTVLYMMNEIYLNNLKQKRRVL